MITLFLDTSLARRCSSAGSRLKGDKLGESGNRGGTVELAKGMENADEGFECPRAALIFRTVGNLACDDRRPQVSLPAIVGGLDLLAQEPQHMSPTVLRADSVEQPLTIPIAKPAVSEVGSQFHVQCRNRLPPSLWPQVFFVGR